MNPNATIERDLERWLDAEARGRAPDGLHSAILERARTVSQRPAWFAALRVGDFPRSPGATGRPAMPARLGLRFAIAVAAILVATGAGLFLKLSPAVTGGPSLVPGPSASVEPSGTPGPLETSSAVQPKPGMFAFIQGSGYAGQLWVANTDGTGARQLASDLAGSKSAPAWSGDGTRLVFTLTPLGGMGGAYPNPANEGSRLYLTDLTGSAPPQPVDTGCVAPCSGDSDASFSSGGTRLVFVRTEFLPARPVSPDPLGKGPWTPYARVLATIDLSTGRVMELASTLVSEVSGNFQGSIPADYHPRWSPDGTQIVFTQDVPIPASSNGTPVLGPVPALFVVDADGRNLRKLGPAAQSADWSPDGTRLVFDSPSDVVRTAVGLRQYVDIQTVRPDGTDLRRLTSDHVSHAPSWTADGRIRFLRDQIVADLYWPQLWMMDADGGNATRPSLAPLIQQLVHNYSLPVWQPTP
jgi:dipeptidyl aminopeptidase/acylaminoacyl peptidase